MKGIFNSQSSFQCAGKIQTKPDHAKNTQKNEDFMASLFQSLIPMTDIHTHVNIALPTHISGEILKIGLAI